MTTAWITSWRVTQMIARGDVGADSQQNLAVILSAGEPGTLSYSGVSTSPGAIEVVDAERIEAESQRLGRAVERLVAAYAANERLRGPRGHRRDVDQVTPARRGARADGELERGVEVELEQRASRRVERRGYAASPALLIRVDARRAALTRRPAARAGRRGRRTPG
jgi:hypothetical protein